MKATLNTHVLTTTRVRSASVGPLGTLVHRMADAGEYAGAVVHDGKEVFELSINVADGHAQEQLDVDVSSLRHSVYGDRRPLSLGLRTGGYLVLYSSSGRGGVHVVLQKRGTQSDKERQVFDSRCLRENDLFAVTLIRPGSYSVFDELGKGRGAIRVQYPAPSDAPTQAPDPVHVTVKHGQLDPSDVEIRPAQPVVFTVAISEAAIAVNLEEPDDGPKNASKEKKAPKKKKE